MASKAKESSSSKARGKGPTTVARAYLEAINDRDLDAAAAMWDPSGIDHLHGLAELTIPHGLKQYFGELFAAFPDFEMEILTIAASKEHAAARWRITGTFNGPGKFQGMSPNGAAVELEGCDMLKIRDGKIVENHAYTNATELARQLGAMPPAGSAGERALISAVNARTAATKLMQRVRDN